MTTSEFMDRWDSFHDILFAFAIKLTKNREDAKDLYQETILRAFAHKDRFRIGTNFKAWTTTIMRNNYINDYRKRLIRNQVEQPLEKNMDFLIRKAVQNEAGTNIMMEELTNMLTSIGDAHRIPFLMFFQGHEYQEISKTLGLSLGTVKSRIFFARKKLKGLIRERYGKANFRKA